MLNAILILLSYLLGSISFSFIIGKTVKGIDIREYGSGNAGATNTLRVLGKGPAVLVLALDIVKGIAAVWAARALAPDLIWVHVLCGIAVIIGHNWPVFFGFRGGKGIATTIGVMATLSLLPALCAGIIALVLVALTRFVSLGSLVFTALLPVFLVLWGKPEEIIYTSLLVCAFAFYRHRTNIVKLLQGKENKLGASRK
ncbi:glycerol-3-phosphate 1-O-acyltransferase PlsY [Paenibacillus gansuensis]|uniref:Glycerol-3-phosphate acyltransferase n=1 Tax=Paenibacillus gansuensis TaxID=306542 RepID=A0ABW5P9Q1_9BACL